jgi:hypothetical protein
MSSRKTVGLALGSGSSSGWAHIGAIEALEIDYCRLLSKCFSNFQIILQLTDKGEI